MQSAYTGEYKISFTVSGVGSVRQCVISGMREGRDNKGEKEKE